MEEILNIFYRVKCKNSKNTLDQYQRFIGEFLDYIKITYGIEDDFNNIKQFMVQEYITYLDGEFQDKRYKETKMIHLSNESKYARIKVVSSLFTWLYKNDFIKKNVSEVINLKQFKSKEHHDIYLNQESMSLLIQYLNDDSFIVKGNRCEEFNKARDLFAYALLGKLGNRSAELQTLTFNDLDLPNSKITIKAENRKNKTKLVNKLDGQLKEFYDKYMDAREKRGITSELVYTSQNGNKLYRSNINNNLRKRLREANLYAEYIGSDVRINNINDITTHKLRHSASYNMLKHGLSYPQIASVLGQKQVVKVTQNIYGHINNMELPTVQL